MGKSGMRGGVRSMHTTFATFYKNNFKGVLHNENRFAH